jgi:sRNA-binding carbon storage regulator CsrA
LCVTMHEKSSEYVDIDDGRIKIFLQKTKGRSASVLFIAAKSVKIHRKIESF